MVEEEKEKKPSSSHAAWALLPTSELSFRLMPPIFPFSGVSLLQPQGMEP